MLPNFQNISKSAISTISEIQPHTTAIIQTKSQEPVTMDQWHGNYIIKAMVYIQAWCNNISIQLIIKRNSDNNIFIPKNNIIGISDTSNYIIVIVIIKRKLT